MLEEKGCRETIVTRALRAPWPARPMPITATTGSSHQADAPSKPRPNWATTTAVTAMRVPRTRQTVMRLRPCGPRPTRSASRPPAVWPQTWPTVNSATPRSGTVKAPVNRNTEPNIPPM
ncbi:hypothetical protein Pen01_64500 [Phytomonospora endophytica]|nr:hypothetical protein Pen01_64500 [Phytomonospora endophytica]